MTVLNQLIAKAKRPPRPKEVTISANHLGSLVDDYIAKSVVLQNNDETILFVKDAIIRGDLTLMGVPVRVIGKEATS